MKYRQAYPSENIYIYVHPDRPYVWIWRAHTPKGRVSKYFHTFHSKYPDGFKRVHLPKLPKGYKWLGPFVYNDVT